MKITDVVDSVFSSNEEKRLLQKINRPVIWESLTEREQLVANNLVRKGLVSKFRVGNNVMVKDAEINQ